MLGDEDILPAFAEPYFIHDELRAFPAFNDHSVGNIVGRIVGHVSVCRIESGFGIERRIKPEVNSVLCVVEFNKKEVGGERLKLHVGHGVVKVDRVRPGILGDLYP